MIADRDGLRQPNPECTLVRRALPIALWLCALVALMIRLVGLGRADAAYDFATFYAAGKLAFSPEVQAVYDRLPGEPYNIPADGLLAQTARRAGYPVTVGQYYSLPICLIFYRLPTWLPLPAAYRLWQLAIAASFLASVVLIVRLVRRDASTTSRLVWIVLAAGLGLISHPLCYDSQLGNISAMLLLGYVAAYWFDGSGRSVLAGAVLGCCLVLKPTPVPLLLFFILRRRWVTSIACAATVALLIIASVSFYGWQMHQRWAELMGYYAGHSFCNWNTQAILSGLLRFDVANAAEIRLWNAQAISTWVKWTQGIAVLVMLAAWLATARRWHDERAAPAAYGAGLLLVTVMGPFAWTHYFVVAVWPMVVLADMLLDRWTARRGWTAALLVFSVLALMARPESLFDAAWSARHWPLPQIILDGAQRLVASATLIGSLCLFAMLCSQMRRAGPAAARPGLTRSACPAAQSRPAAPPRPSRPATEEPRSTGRN